MNKSLLIVASLALGTAAWAQTDPSAPAGADPGASQASQSGATQTPAEQGSTPSESSQSPSAQTPAMPDASQGGAAMQPAPGGGDMNSGQSMTPGSGAAPSQGMQSGMASGSTDTSNYPKCGKGVTDKCVQAGGSGGSHHATGHRTMRHSTHHTAKKPS